MTRHRHNPEHWIWHADLPHHFEPDEDAYLAFRELAPAALCHEVERLIAEGMSAEQIATLCDFEQTLPPYVLEVIGAALAFWVQRAQEG